MIKMNFFSFLTLFCSFLLTFSVVTDMNVCEKMQKEVDGKLKSAFCISDEQWSMITA